MKSESKYIFSKGDLSRQDFSIKYKNEKGNFYLPIEKIKEIYCFNDIKHILYFEQFLLLLLLQYINDYFQMFLPV